MAFLDKVKDIASAAGEKAGDAIEVTKLNSKISTEKAGINESFGKIGEMVFNKLTEMETIPEELKAFLPDGLEELLDKVKGHKSMIEDLKKKIEEVKND